MLFDRLRATAVAFFLCALLALPTSAQVVFDAASNATPATASIANPITVSWNHTVGLAKKPYLVVGISLKLNGGGATVGAVTYGAEAGGPNQAMTFLGAATNGTTVRAELWGLSNPTAGTHQITVSVTNGGGQNVIVVAGAKSYTNVFQTSPTGNVVNATGTSTTPAVTTTNTPMAAVVDAVAFNSANALTAGVNQTNAYNVTNGAPAFSGGGSMELGQTNSVMSWTGSPSSAWATVAVPLLPSNPQIHFDAASSKQFAANTNPSFTGSWNHTTTTAANRYLVVGVSMDLSGGAQTVSGVRYGTEAGGPNVAMSLLGFRANGTNVRTDLWGLVAPASGTHQITVTIGNNTGTRNTNVVAGAQSFSGVEQPAPTGTFVSATGGTATTILAVTNSAYDYVVDAVAWNSNVALTPGAQQDQRYGINTAAAAPVTSFFGGGSDARGYTNTTMSWTQAGGGQQWSTSAIPLKQTSIVLNMTASADVIKLGQSITYTITATNYGSTTATNVIVTDAIPSGTTFVSQTGCAGTGPVSCNIGSLAAGATSAPITITVTPDAAGTTTNTASVTFNGGTTANNSETLTTVAEAKICASPGKDGAGGTLSGIKNDYWPGASTIAAGSTSMTIGARTAGGAGNTINAGDLLILMQMQDAAFDTTNDETYGEGTGSTRGTGIGSGAATTLNNAGRWEYAVAANSVSAAGGTLQINGGGPGGGTLYSYTSEAFATTSTEGQRTWQVIRVPQYTTATLGSTLTALPWNGATGGVLAVDVSGTLTLGGATVSVNGLGYRGGGGRVLGGDATAGLAATDFRTSASLTTNGSKAEGITGTPRFVYQNGATIGAPNSGNAPLDTGVEGYVGGSYGRGAPGNAGGGSTDGDPPGNDMNSGGGGGGNAGMGGAGGNGWSCDCPSGGQGGGGISPSLTRITMGGGGGAGTTNNASAETCVAPPTCRVNVATDWVDTETGTNGYYSSGANGGGVIIIRALQATGTGTLTANGFSAYNTGRDGSGGGGAGGSVLFTTQSGDLSGVTVQAKGGNGGNAWLTTAPGGSPGQRHGPGGGGGGGYVLLSSAPASVDVSGGANGVTTSANDPYGAQPGTSGSVQYLAGASVLPGGDGASCAVADLAVTDSSPATPVAWGGNVTFTQTVVNNGPSPADTIVYSTSIPSYSTFQSMSVPPGWTCITPAVGGSGNITCTRPTLASTDGTQNFSITVQANNGTPSGYLIANTNSVSSLTPDSNTANNSASSSTPVEVTADSDMQVTLTNNATTTTTAGSNVTFTSVAKNVGGSAATSATWSMAIPANTTYQSLIPPPGWTCITPAVGGTGTINCMATGTIAVGATNTFQPVFKVNAGTAAGTTITGTATTGASNDEDPTNNTASSSFMVRGASGYDMVATMAASPDPVYPAESLTFTSVVSNNGPASAPATGAGVQWVMNVPSGTNFQSLTPPAGWSCTTPAVGATSGAITCTYQTGGVNQAFTPGTTSTFKPLFAVNASTATGTTITGTATVDINGVTTGDNVPANNTASDTALVTASTNADVAIVKAVGPSSIGDGQNTNYSFTITNNGPATATNVTFSDVFPASLTFGSYAISGSVGGCSYNSGTSTLACTISTLPVGNSVTLTVIAQATSTGTIPNTVNITSLDQTDPVSSNNSSTANLTVFAVTLIRLRDFAVRQHDKNVLITWQTSYEADNLGFNLYRDIAGQRTKINHSLIAGTALVSKKHDAVADHVYRFRDTLPDPNAAAQYWLEDVDIKGVKTMHGPVSTVPGAVDQPANATPLPGLGANGSVFDSAAGFGVPHAMTIGAVSPQQIQQQQDLAGDPALKIYVSQEGWIRVTRAAMIAAGFDPGRDGRQLALYTAGVEQAMVVNSASDGSFDSIEFYGVPLDTPSTGARAYWLRAGKGSARRIASSKIAASDPLTASVPYTYEKRDRSLLFVELTKNNDNGQYFGPLISNTPDDQPLSLGNVDTSYAGNATLEVTIQGATDQMIHSIDLAMNGHDLGNASLANQDQTKFTFTFPQSWLVNGTNTLTFTALNGDNDVSVAALTRVTYQHALRADAGAIEAGFPAMRAVTVGGFTTANVRAIDLTDISKPVELATSVAADPAGGFAATFTAPGSGTHTVLAFDDSRVVTTSELVPNAPSSWSSVKNKDNADLLIITNSAFRAAASTLVPVRQRDGISAAVIDVEDLYDEFNFGMRDPQAIRAFLESTRQWKTPPRWVLLVGDASVDPRNYLGTGAFDFVPTKMIPTLYLETSSDDWFTDFDGDGIADIAIGRIPVRTADEAALVFGKITGRGTPSGAWAQSVVAIADRPIGFDFPGAASTLLKLVPPTLTTKQLNLADSATPGADITAAMNNGALIVDYIGHGSVEVWSDLAFQSPDAMNLTNGSRLPFVVAMECLNGYFHDVYTDSMAEALLKASNGGAAAVWASSALTEPDQQALMNQELFRQLFAKSAPTLGEAVMRAKRAATDPDVRRSWILFGDPSMKLK